MRSAEWKTRVVPGLLSGTSRQPLRLEGTALAGASNLAALSLAGQALRFERQIAPTEFAVETPVVDPRRILPEAVRKPMIWLLRRRRPTESVELALAWNFARLNLRPHPFDLPRLGSFARTHAEELGTTAQVWASREGTAHGKPVVERCFFGAEELDETNWTAAQPARRVEFILSQRRQDDAKGLALVRSVWSQEEPDTRVRLLGAIAATLQPADKEFLEVLQKDRAPRVRDLAQRMLSRLPGATGTHPALAACLERIEATSTGLLRKKTALKLQLPANVKESAAGFWVRETLADVSCEELARGLHLSETAMIEAAASDEKLLLAIALMATADRRVDLLELAVKRMPEAWETLAQTGPIQLDGMSPEDRRNWATALIQPYGSTPPFSFGAWSWMHRAIRGPLPSALMDAVLRSSQWRDKLRETKGPDWMELLAACCPAVLRQRLRVLLDMIEPTQTADALTLLDILDAMEKA